MSSSHAIHQHAEIRALEDAEIDCVAGGMGVGIDITGMPNYDQMCGTMWLLQHILKGGSLPRP
jgi:hypothetical protein